MSARFVPSSSALRSLSVAAIAVAVSIPAAMVSASTAAAGAGGYPDRGHGPGDATSVAWSDVPTGSTARFRGLAPVSDDVAWVSGTAGTVLRTADGGRHWRDVSPGGDAATLEFRDVEAFDSRHAVVLSIGEGGDSRVYRTTDGGASWQRTFTNDAPDAFYDCLGFWDSRHGIAMSDPVDGRFRVLRTDDSGRTWSVVDPAGMPPALEGEFGFAASGTCLVTAGRRDAWIATGGGATSRVLHTRDRGRTWTAASTPVRSTEAGGIFSLAVRGTRDLVAVGGDYLSPEVGADAAATSRDGGRTWRASGPLGGYRSGSAWLPSGRLAGDRDGYGHEHGDRSGDRGHDSRRSQRVVAVGPTGTDLSSDGGRTWSAVDTGSLDSVECTRDGACWASGEKGRVAVLTRRH